MDGIRAFDQGASPLSSKFQTTAIQNMQTQIASVKDNKDLNEDDAAVHHQHHHHDAVQLSMAAESVTEEQQMSSAENSGELAELTDDFQKDDDEKIREHAFNEEAEQALRMKHPGNGQIARSKDTGESRQVDGVSATTDRDRLHYVKSDVPPEIFEAATQFVKGQMISDTQPTQSLMQLKSVAEQGEMHTQKEDFLPMMDIHDSHNQPMPLEMQEASL